MKKVTEELRYDGATIEQVYDMLSDEAFRREVCDRQGVVRHDVSTERQGDRLKTTIDQVHTAKGLPSFATRIVGDEINIVQREDWMSPAKGDIEVVIPGKPGEMTGTVHLTEDPQGVTETINLTIKVGIPLVGGKIEGLIADMLLKALRTEGKVGRERLGG
ncbi:DUF2505 domain-containing protein [Nocardioides marmoraquaticus]